jgi:hypothetical protein
VTTNDDLDALLRRIRRRRRSVDAYLRSTRPRAQRLTNVCIVSSALASLLMSGPGVGGEAFIGETVRTFDLDGPPQAWQPICLLAAVCAFTAAVTASLSKSRNAEAKIVSAEACASELEGLEALVEFKQVTLEQSVKLYQQYVARVPFITEAAGARKRSTTRRGWRSQSGD